VPQREPSIPRLLNKKEERFRAKPHDHEKQGQRNGNQGTYLKILDL
jgi:hypothetical protein